MILRLSKRREWNPWVVICLTVLSVAPLAHVQAAKKGDAKLNELQKAYDEWTGETFRSFLCQGKFEGASKEAKAQAAQAALAVLQRGRSAGAEYYTAINALAELKCGKAISPLLAIAVDRAEKDNRDRWMATRALGLIGDRRVTPELIPLVYHYNQNARMWAQISLVRLTGQNFGFDSKAWGDWWNKSGGKPAFDPQPVRWTTRSAEGSEPPNYEEDGAQFVARYNAKQSPAAKGDREALRKKFTKRLARDQKRYTAEQLSRMESLYQVANKKWGTPEARDSLKELLAKYEKANRVGCALVYMGQMASGDDKEQYLRRAMEFHGDCWYGDGVNVGAYARLHLADHYKDVGKADKAIELWKEILAKYPKAIDHQGNLLRETVKRRLKAAGAL